jgi:glycosyltransferase involved in cell wall biosynthesis
MKKPKVSVVVPIYNVEKYLRQCLDSIVGQTLKDIEIILVDDGGTDGCPAIVDEYAARDGRVVAIHKKNGGLGEAYNTGVARATGEYVGFVESDDWAEPDMFELLYDAAKKRDADISKAPFYIYNSLAAPERQNSVWRLSLHGRTLLDLTEEAPKGVFNIDDFPKLAFMHSSLWTYLYRADFIRQIPFVESRGASYQDFPFVFEVLCRAKSIVVVPKPLLHWRLEKNQGNSTMQIGKRVLQMPKRCLEGKKILRKYGKYDTLKEAFYLHCCTANQGFYKRCEVNIKHRYFQALREVFRDMTGGAGFRYEYFDKAQKDWVEQILRNDYIKTILKSWLDWKRFIVSVNIKRTGFIVQLFGLQISAGKRYANRPALLAIRLGKKAK